MERHNHYGIDVLFQIVETSFKKQLKDNGIAYIDLPVVENVIKYTTNGLERYALIVPCGVESYAEKVYITPEIPLDMSWEKLKEDIDNQLYGKKNPPMEMETKAHMLCRMVEEANNKQQNDFWNTCMENEIDPLDFRMTLRTLGYEVEDLLEMDCHDVDVDKLNRMKD